jgi:RimJ/RimL family protein N-acetyltransferase
MPNELFTSLYDAQDIYLDAIDYDKDAPVEAAWTHDLDYLRLLSPDLARPLSQAQVKKKYEAIEKDADEHHNLFYFQIRRQPRPVGDSPSGETAGEAGRLVGFGRIYWIEWAHGSGQVQLGIGNPADRRQGFGSQALRLLLRHAFDELNLFRLTAPVPGYNLGAMKLLEKQGFVEEVRRRQSLLRDGQRWDMVLFGILRSEWEAQQ